MSIALIEPGYVASGFLVGLLVGLTGVGGGSLMTPLLTAIFGISPKVAVGTDLAFAAITKGTGTLIHRMRGTVNWHVVRLMCLGSLPAALLSIIALHYFGNLDAAITKIIRWSIAFSVMLTVVVLLFKGRLMNWLNAHPEKWLNPRQQTVVTIIGAAIIGILVTVSSIGAGAIGATFMAFVHPRLRAAEIAGTDIAYAVPLTALAAIGHASLGTINWVLLASLLVGSLPGITIGSYASKSVPEKILRGILAATLTAVAGKMVMS